MPFKSQAQRGFMFAKHPDVAKRFAAETPKGAKLPYHVGGGMSQGGPKTGMLSKLYGKKGK